MGTYAIAYADENGNGFTDNEPWIEDGFGKDLESCKRRAAEMIRNGLKQVIVFQFGAQLCETYSWDYVKQHEI